MVLIISKREGVEKLLNLINGKLRTQFKNDSVYKNILNLYKTSLVLNQPFHLDQTTDLNSHWLAGFSDADASFQIKLLTKKDRKNRIEVRLNFQIDQKKRHLLDLIKNKLGGNIGYRKNTDTFY